MAAPTPSLALFNRVKAEFVARGTSLTKWCQQNGTHVSNARTCLTGSWNGPAAQKLRARLCAAADVTAEKVAA